MRLAAYEAYFGLRHQGERSLGTHDELREVEGIFFLVVHTPERVSCRILRYLRTSGFYEIRVGIDERVHLPIDETFERTQVLFLGQLRRGERPEGRGSPV